MPVDDASHDGQAQPVPARRTVRLSSRRRNGVKTFSQSASDTGAVVVHIQPRRLPIDGEADPHLPLGMAHGIGDQIAQRAASSASAQPLASSATTHSPRSTLTSGRKGASSPIT